MTKKKSTYNQILERLDQKASLKQQVFRNTCRVFKLFKEQLSTIADELKDDFGDKDSHVEIAFTDVNDFEAQLKFSGDVLIFSMHSNIFTFPPDDSIHKMDYIKEDISRRYCGVIHIHNFLADSLKYNRISDVGYLVSRIYVNKEDHFFADGNGSIGKEFNDISKDVITDKAIRKIIEMAIVFCMDFDLLSPPYEVVRELSLEQKQFLEANSGYPTVKKIGYRFKAELAVEEQPPLRKNVK